MSDLIMNKLRIMVQRYALPIWFGRSDGRDVRNGTATLIRIYGHSWAITCQHVIDGYVQQARVTGDSVLQLGGLHVDLGMVRDSSTYPDMATIDLTGLEDALGPQERVRFYEPLAWPPTAVSEGDLVYYYGFPGALRRQPAALDLSFASTFVLGDVQSSATDRAYTRIELGECDVHGPAADEIQLGAFSPGGMSGGPVFAVRDASVFHAELVGIVTEYQQQLDLLKFHPLSLVKSDGTIVTVP